MNVVVLSPHPYCRVNHTINCNMGNIYNRVYQNLHKIYREKDITLYPEEIFINNLQYLKKMHNLTILVYSLQIIENILHTPNLYVRLYR